MQVYDDARRNGEDLLTARISTTASKGNQSLSVHFVTLSTRKLTYFEFIVNGAPRRLLSFLRKQAPIGSNGSDRRTRIGWVPVLDTFFPSSYCVFSTHIVRLPNRFYP